MRQPGGAVPPGSAIGNYSGRFQRSVASQTDAPHGSTDSSIIRDIAFFVALLATALALGAELAHALELPNKIGMSREHYFIV